MKNLAYFRSQHAVDSGRGTQDSCWHIKDKGFDNKSKPMINFIVRIHHGNGFSGGIWKDEEKLFWNNERGGCCFGQKKQGINIYVMLWKLWK